VRLAANQCGAAIAGSGRADHRSSRLTTETEKR
jgi:hypothetical protein